MKYFFYVFVLLICTSSFAQYQPLEEVKLGPQFRGKGKWNDIKFVITTDDGKIYSVSERSGNRSARMVIDVFNEKMRHKTQYYIKGDRNDDFVAGNFINGELKFLSFNRKKGIGTLYRVDTAEEEFIEDRIIFDYSDKKLEKESRGGWGPFNGGSTKSKDVDTFGYFEMSKDGNYYLFAMDVDTGGNGDEEHEIVVLDSNFNVHFTRTLSLPRKDKLYNIEAFSLSDSDGSVLVTSKAYEGGKRKESNRKSRREKEANYHLEIINLNKEGFKEYSFGNEKFFLEKVATATQGDRLYLSGYFSKTVEDGHQGIYVGVFDTELNPISSKLHDFTDEFISEMHWTEDNERRTKRRKRDQDSRLDALELLYDSQGNSYLVGEEQSVVVTSERSMNSGNYSTVTIYNTNQIAVTKFDSAGNLVSNQLIRKFQQSRQVENDVYSYYAFIGKGRLNIFFNAAELNKKKSDKSLTFKRRKESKLDLINVQMDDSGKLVYKKVLSAIRTGKKALSIRRAKRINKSSFLVDGNNGKNKRFAKITL